MKWPKVNAHLHSPYSFSAFDSISQALDMAAEQDVKVVGINDFNTTAGYIEWRDRCADKGLYPLYNIEFITLRQREQADGIRVNDPNNPGRTYLSGKGLACPPSLPEPYSSQLADVVRHGERQVRAMCGKLNDLLDSIEAGFRLDFDEVKKQLTLGNVRERHLAKALRMEVYAHCDAPEAMFEKLFGGKPMKSGLDDFAGVENEIRANLLKAGGAAFVAEDPRAFLPLEDVCNIIEAAGGIPTYPFLADDTAGNFTDFEANLEQAAVDLCNMGIHSVEFIPTRNTLQVLERYCEYLYDAGFVVTMGSEHNTPAMEPIELFARGGVPLTEKLIEINYNGACVIAAHQAIYAADGCRYDPAMRERYIALGDELIKAVI